MKRRAAKLDMSEGYRFVAEGRAGVKSQRPARPLSPDAIFLETIVQVYFFSVVQFWRFWIWLAGEL